MNKQTLSAVAYVENAISFIFLDASIDDLISQIYLYGSSVRGGLTKNSDIDIFIDCAATNEKTVEKIAKSAISRFYNSKDYEKWKLFGFSHPISIQAGRLSEWELKTSIMAEGVLLYSEKPQILPAERKVIFIIELPNDKKKYLHLIRTLFGRKEKGYKDKGIISEINGEKLSSNIIIIPKASQQKIMQLLQNKKIDYSMKEMCVFE